MRRIRYQVACSLDGYIAGPGGEYDWIVSDSELDFEAIFSEFDTALMGRRTYEATGGELPGMDVLVFSRSLRWEDHPDVAIVSDRARDVLEELRSRPGKDIWLFGGGDLFASLLALDCVDTIEPAIIPIVLGGGRPLLPAPAVRRRLRLTEHRVFEESGIVLVRYAVVRPGAGHSATPPLP